MKKLILLVLISLVAAGSIFVSCNDEKGPLLKDDEQFLLDFNSSENKLNISIRKSDIIEPFDSVKTSWGDWQTSLNEKKILFWQIIDNKKKFTLIDGEKGVKKSIQVADYPFTCDRNFETYLVNEPDSLNFVLKNLSDGKIIKQYTWELNKQDEFTDPVYYAAIYPCIDNTADFIITIETDGHRCAIAKLDIKAGVIISVEDKSPDEIQLLHDSWAKPVI